MRYFLSLLMLAGLAVFVPSSSHAIAIQALYGAQMACDPAIPTCTPIPLTFSSLCTSGCPLRAAPSLTDSTRFWGTGRPDAVDFTSCRTSTNGGSVWADCTAQAFAPALSSVYAGAADGSVIAAGSAAGPLCTIRRSTNNATSWSTVFTLAINCDLNNNEGQWLFCLGDGRCEFIAPGISSGAGNRLYRSSDNGQNWTAGETTTNTWISSLGGAAWDGSSGISKGPGASSRSLVATADLWVNSAVWPAGPDALGCRGPVIYNSTPRVVCFEPAVPAYRLYDSLGSVVATLTIPQARLLIDEGSTVMGYSSTVLYLAATKTRVPLPCGGGLCSAGFYVSTDNLASFILLGEVTIPGVGDMRAGNAFRANGCVYFDVGIASAAMIFAKVC